jgi:hypothetical protein
MVPHSFLDIFQQIYKLEISHPGKEMFSLILNSIFLLSTVNALGVSWYAQNANPITYFESTLIVPALPNKDWQTVFLWPGNYLQH